MNVFSIISRPLPASIRGVSLVELMVSISIGMFLLLGLATLLSNSSQAHKELQKSSMQIENGRYALQVLSEDIHLAGFYGELAPTTGITWTQPDPCIASWSSTQPASVERLGWRYDESTIPVMTSVPVAFFGYASSTTLPATCTSNIPQLLYRKSGTAVLVIRRVEALAAPTAPDGVSAYLQVSLCPNETKPFVFSASAGEFDLRRKDCSSTNPAVTRKYVQHLYYISSCNVCGSGGDSTPTLKRVELTGGAFTVVPLVEGIEDMQFDYGIDYLPAPTTTTTADGSPECTISDPSSTDTTIDPLKTEIQACPTGTWSDTTANWANVMSVRVHLLARNTESTMGYSDDRSYALGLVKSSTPASRAAEDPGLNKYKRHVYSTLVRAINISGRREPS